MLVLTFGLRQQLSPFFSGQNVPTFSPIAGETKTVKMKWWANYNEEPTLTSTTRYLRDYYHPKNSRTFSWPSVPPRANSRVGSAFVWIHNYPITRIVIVNIIQDDLRVTFHSFFFEVFNWICVHLMDMLVVVAGEKCQTDFGYRWDELWLIKTNSWRNTMTCS